MAVDPPLIAIIGPTASGKSDLALALARHFRGEILSVDSMQVYRGMNIGTAKPSKAEQGEIRHHLIDLVEPNELFAVSRFVDLADAVIADAKKRTAPLIAVGGTPMYWKALFIGLFEGPGADAELRRRLSSLSSEELHARLTKVDPAAARRIHPNDTKRLIRALEVFELSGKPISSYQTEWSAAKPRHQATWIGLLWEKESLNRRINMRVRAMIQAGWVEETRALLDRFGTLSRTASEATGYGELIAHLTAKSALDDAIEQIKIATRQLARRQMKWFRQFPNVHWLRGEIAPEELIGQALSAIQKR